MPTSISAPTTRPSPFGATPAGWRIRRWRLASHVAGAATAVGLAWQATLGSLGHNPVDAVIRTTGKAALALLVASLCATPVSRYLGVRGAIVARRPLGLWAFAYAVGHLAAFAGLDYGLDWGLILADGLPKKPYIVVGTLAWLALLPLAVTSTRGWQRRLGRRWTWLHRLVYPAAVLAAVHFYWVAAATAKGSPYEPYGWAVAIAALLALRLPAARSLRAAVAARARRSG